MLSVFDWIKMVDFMESGGFHEIGRFMHEIQRISWQILKCKLENVKFL